MLSSSEDVDIALSMDGQTVGGNSSEVRVLHHAAMLYALHFTLTVTLQG